MDTFTWTLMGMQLSIPESKLDPEHRKPNMTQMFVKYDDHLAKVTKLQLEINELKLQSQ